MDLTGRFLENHGLHGVPFRDWAFGRTRRFRVNTKIYPVNSAAFFPDSFQHVAMYIFEISNG
jgi:hypothetical protein